MFNNVSKEIYDGALDTSGLIVNRIKAEMVGDKEFSDAINDDLNVPMALGVLWKMLKLPRSKDICLLAQKWDAVFGLSLDKLPEPEKVEKVQAPENVIALAEERLQARKNKDWAKSDELRAQIKQLGFEIKDGPGTYELTKI